MSIPGSFSLTLLFFLFLSFSFFLNDQYSVTLSAPEGVCVFHGTLLTDGGHKQLNKGNVGGNSVALVQFFIMALEVGDHKLSFTLKTKWGSETVIKTLRVLVREHQVTTFTIFSP